MAFYKLDTVYNDLDGDATLYNISSMKCITVFKVDFLLFEKMKKLFYFIFFLLFCFSASSKIYINVGAPDKVKKSLIAVSPFKLQDQKPTPEALAAGQKMGKRLGKNLKFSSYFHLLSPKAFIENPITRASVPYPKEPNGFRWQNWKLTGADFLLFTDYSVVQEVIVLKVSFYNINLQKNIFKKKYHGVFGQTNKMVDQLSNDIIKSLSGKKGIFETKILSVRNTSGTKKELFVMDWNGENKKRLTYHRSIVLSPAWSNDGNQVAYSAFVYNKRLKKRVAALFLYDFRTNIIKLLSAQSGANLGSDFFPGGRQMLITLGSGPGLLDIFKMNLKTKALIPLTTGPQRVINVEPSIHPRTRRIAFSSDKSGKTMIYVMNPSGKNLKQVTFAGHHNSNPDWHPEKNDLVFSGQSQGRMDLFRISAQKTGLKRLTSLKKKNGRWANCESPSFSPDGRFIVFSSDRSGVYQLYVMNLDDLSIERITSDRYNYKSPRWSPYL